MSNQQNRRRLRNMLLDPQKQYRHAVIYFGFVAAGALVLQTILMRTTQRFVLEALIAAGVSPEVLVTTMQGPLRAYLWRCALMFPILALFSLFFAIRTTHRVLGPQVALKRHIAALRDGDYGSTVRLRKNDELHEVADALNELSAALRQRHGEDTEQRAA